MMKMEEIIKKGPWKAEEDEVLINHVKRYGPREWSSIRSNGLLQRTGKSCRLCWVNKLRPNLKTGCKFSEEEEKTVIELQSKFGNKWAAIATYLPGRTDNDVKNFWSSRQKRLARRFLHNSSSDASSSSRLCSKSSSNRTKGKSVKHSRVEEKEIEASSSSSLVDESLRMPELGIELEHQPFAFGSDLGLAETETTTESHTETREQTIPFSPESRELFARFNDPFFYDILGPADSSEPLFALPQPFFEQSPMPRRCRHVSKDEEPDVFLDDFPADMFDQVDTIRSP